MSEITANGNGTTDTLNPEQVAAFLAYQVKEQARKAKAAKAAEDRKRTNNRGTLADGTERNATQAFLGAIVDLMTNWAGAYEEDPKQLIRRMREQLIPSIAAVANTPSTLMAGAQDQFRGLLANYHAPQVAQGPVEAVTPTPNPGNVKK